MLVHRWLALGGLCSFVVACGADDRDVLTKRRPERDGGAAGPGTGGTSRGGDTGMGGEDTPGSGGSSAGSGTVGALDTNEVYLAGTLLEGNNSAGGVALVSEPNVAYVGFSGRLSGMTVEFLGGDFVYQELVTDVVWRMVIDGLTSEQFGPSYPRMPELNDVRMPIAPCDEVGNRLVRFMTGPGEWFVVECIDGYYDAGEPLETGGNILYALGYDGFALATGGILDLSDGSVVRPLNVQGGFIAARAYEDGFYAVFGAGEEFTLWDISMGGRTTNLGTYPPLDPADGMYLTETSRLGSDNALHDLLSGTGERIVRRTVDGDYEVVYDEASMPLVRAVPRSATLVTGP